VIFVPVMDEDFVGRLELVADLRRARVEEEFVLHYQPAVDLGTGAIVGVEALVRWQHPARGLLPPAVFISVAEETGRIVELGRWVLREACRQAVHWRSNVPGAKALGVSVNVSTRQMRRPGLLEDVRDALEDSGLAPEALVLEITESVVARRRDEMISILEGVAALGVRLALDDFGTGYSSLSLLQDLPVQVLKIDRAFVHSLDVGVQRSAFVRAIVDLATTLGLTVVAEGVEDELQAAALRQLGCRRGQGFYFAPPLEARAIDELFASGGVPRLPGRGSARRAAA
jgi:EAL domain-containing protein (putative c-di-GMP-specific phosphodiesterase class I)